MPRFPSVPRIDKAIAHAGSGLYNALTPRTHEPSGIPAGQNAHQYLYSLLQSINPSTPSGVFNLAAMFVPGPGRGGGGKYVGALTAGQKEMLRQLHNVRLQTKQGPALGPGGHHTYELTSNDVPTKLTNEETGRTVQFSHIPDIVGLLHPESRSIVDRLGYTHEDPGRIQHELLGGNHAGYKTTQARQKLGWDEYGFPPDQAFQLLARTGDMETWPTQWPKPLNPEDTPGIARANRTPTVNEMLMNILDTYAQRGRDHPNPWSEYLDSQS